MQQLDPITSDIFKIKDPRFFDLSQTVINFKHDIQFLEQETAVHKLNSIPKRFLLADIIDVDCVSKKLLDYCRKFREEICNEFDFETGLMVYYPEEGFIDWHTNENVPYYTAICTYSHNGSSFFEYIDKDNNTVRIQDPLGWSVKFTKWSSEKPIWHRAVSQTDRITIAFIAPEKEKIRLFIDNIKGDKIGKSQEY